MADISIPLIRFRDMRAEIASNGLTNVLELHYRGVDETGIAKAEGITLDEARARLQAVSEIIDKHFPELHQTPQS